MNHSRHAASAALALLTAAVLGLTPAAHAYYAGGGKDADKGNDCLIGYEGIDASDVTDPGSKKQAVVCVDCDPSCDHDGADVANGSCTFEVSACINQPGVEGCTPASGLTKATAKGKVKGQKGKVVIEVPQLLEGSACGAVLNLVVPVKMTKKGDKDGSGTVKLSALQKKNKDAGVDKTRKDKDKLKYVCQPRPEGEACPAPVEPCGNGTIDEGEECDPAADPTGCGAGETCIAPGQSQTFAACTCQPCVEPTTGDPGSISFTTGVGTDYCAGGTQGFGTPPNPPFSGSIADAASTEISPLGQGCLYIGGGTSTVAGGATPDSAPNIYDVALVCDAGDRLELVGSAGTGDRDCSLGAGPGKRCVNGHPGTDGNGACTQDSDCAPVCDNNVCVNGAPGTDGQGACTNAGQCGSGSETLVCLPIDNCHFGPPLPVKNGPLSTCVFNVFSADGGGTAHVSSGEISLSVPLSSWVHFTGSTYGNNLPCPQCISGTCSAGPNQGQSCTPVGADLTTYDCPPDPYFFLAPLSVTLDPLTTATSTMPVDGNPSSDGLFCPGQNFAGAFGNGTVRLITEVGQPVAGGLDTTGKASTLGSAFCIPATGNVLIDGAADLPGPGATSLGGTAQLQLK